MSMNKFLIPCVLAATILIAGVFAFIPVQKATTFDQFIIAALTGDAGITNQNIAEELKDKLKLMVQEEEEFLEIGDEISFSPFVVDGFTIEVEARNALEENVLFNLKEVYLCGYSGNGGNGPPPVPITIQFVYIENVIFDPTFGFVVPGTADIKITDLDGTSLGIDGIDVIDGYTCVDLVSALADNGRAGAVGLGSDSNLVIELSGDLGDHVDFVKCITFTPNEATTLKCDLEPILGPGGD